LLGWLLGALGAVVLEHIAGDPFSELLGLPKIPVLFGALVRNVNEIRPTYSPEFKRIFGNNFSNLKKAIGILKSTTI